MPLWPAAKLMDSIVGIDVHAVAPIPGIPIHPYFGLIYLWHTPKFPMADTFINNMPACTVGSMGYSVHIPQGVPVPPTPTNSPYWKRYLTNIAMGATLMGLTIFANMAIAGIAALIPKPKSAEGFIKDVTGIDTTTTATAWTTIQTSFSALTKWQTWVKLLMPPIPYPGAQGSTAVGSPNVSVNGAPLAFVAPLMATSCSDIPIVPNAATIGFSNVLVGVSISAMIKGVAVSMVQNAMQVGMQKGVKKGMDKLKNNKDSKQQGKKQCSCSS